MAIYARYLRPGLIDSNTDVFLFCREVTRCKPSFRRFLEMQSILGESHEQTKTHHALSFRN
jgi:hypothetical protein